MMAKTTEDGDGERAQVANRNRNTFIAPTFCKRKTNRNKKHNTSQYRRVMDERVERTAVQP